MAEDKDGLAGILPPKATAEPSETATATPTTIFSPLRKAKQHRALATTTRSFALRLEPEEEIVEALQKTVQELGLRAAFVQTCVGSVNHAVVRLANATAEQPNEIVELTQKFEICSLVGTLGLDAHDEYSKHIHVTLADAEGRCIGGHVISLKVFTTAEIVLGECLELQFSREQDDRTGFPELRVSKRV
eukprot:m.287477 g.287477  ORF g.287477 m.287477 type:complete len:189 (+) comp17788_c0_seq2:12099-12665(+)